MILRDIFKKQINEGGNLASHTAAGTPTVGWTGVPGTYSAGKIDSKNRAAMQPAVKQLLVDINNLFTKQYGRPIWSPELIEKEVETFISGSSKWFMQLRQPNPRFNPNQPESDANPKEIGVADKDFQRVKKKVGDIDTQIDRRLEPQIEEFVHKNIGANIGSATLLGTKKGSDQWLALWQVHEPPITLQVDLEFSDYTTDARGFEIPTEWAQVSHGSAWEDLEVGMKGVFRQWLYRSLAKVAPTDKYIAKVTGAGKKKGVRIFGGDDGKEYVADLDSPPPPFHDANFSFAVASVGGGGVRAKYRQPTPEENIPLEINGVPVMVPLEPKDSEYIKDMSLQFEQFFGVPAEDNQTKMMASFVGSVELMKQYFTPDQHQIVVNEFLKINFGKGAQMIDADDPTTDFKTKMTAIDYLLDQTGMKNMRKQVLQMAKDYEAAFNAKKPAQPLAEAEVKAQLRKGMPHLRDLKATDFLDLLDEISDGNGNFRLQNIPLNVKVDGFGGRFGKNADGKPFMGTSRTEPRYQAGFLAYHKQKGTTDPDILGRAQLFDQLFNEMMNAIQLVDSKLGAEFLVNKQVTCEVLYLPFATETPEGKLKFVGIQYDKLPEGVQLALVPFRVTDAGTGEDLEDSNKFIKELLSVGSSGSVMFIDNSLTQKEGLDVTELINPLDNIEELKQIVSDTSGKRDRISQQLKREVEEKLQPIKLSLEKAIIEDPNIIGKDILGQDYEGIVINSRLGPIKVTSQEQRDVISAKNAAMASARSERPRGEAKTAVVAIGSFVGHKGHQDLFKYTIDKAKELGGDPYLFIGNAEGKDDPIPPAVKVQTWHKLYPEYANNISTVQQGGSLIQKVKHELINPLPGKPPRYDNIVIMVGEDRAGLSMPTALMKAVNKFPGYEHVKVSLGITPRESGFSGTMLRNSLKNDAPEKALAVWSKAFDEAKLGKDWILHLMDITRRGMGIAQQPAVEPAPVVAERLSSALIRPRTNEATFKKSPYGRTAASQQRARELLNPPKPPEPKKGVAENYHSDLMKQTYAKFFKPAPPKTVLAVKKFLSDVIISLGTAQDNDYNDNDEEISWEQDLSDVREAYGKLRSNTSPNWFDIADSVLSYDTEFRESMLEWAEEELGSKLVDFLWDEVWEAKHKISRADGSYNIDVGHQDASGQQSDRDSYKPWDPEKDPPNPFADLKWKVMINGEQKVKFGGVGNNQEAAMKVALTWARSHGYEREVQAGKIKVVQVQQGVNEFAPGNGGGESGRWYTDDQMTDIDTPKKNLKAFNLAENDPWGDQGNFAGGPVNVGGATVKQLEIGDTVTYIGQRAKIVNMTSDRKMSRITIFSNFGGTTKDVLTSDLKRLGGSVEEKFKTGPAAHFTPKDKHVKIGQFVGGEGKKKGADGKACWDNYRYNGTENGKDKCVKVSEDVENIMDALINKIIVNEAIQNKQR